MKCDFPMCSWRHSVEEFLNSCPNATFDGDLIDVLIDILEKDNVACLLRLLHTAAASEVVKLRDRRKASLLHYAVSRQQHELSEELIQNGACVNASCSRGFTPLHIAACVPDGKLARMLLDAGANSNACNNFMDTSLTLAAFSGGYDVIKVLLEKETHLNESSAFGYTALYNAIEEKHVECVQLLLQAGARADCAIEAAVGGTTPLYLACERVLEPVVEQLVQQPCLINTLESSQRGWSAMHYCAANGTERCLRALLTAKDVDINIAAGNSKQTPLMVAILENNAFLAKIILSDRHCQINAVDAYSNTALYYASELGHLDLVRETLKRGGLVQNGGIMTSPLSAAILHNHCAIVAELTRAGAVAPTKLLHYSIREGFFKMAAYILLNGVTISAPQAQKWRLVLTLTVKRLTSEQEVLFEGLLTAIRNPRSLLHLCRVAIVTRMPHCCYTHVRVRRLALPPLLKEYLRYPELGLEEL